MVKVIYKSTSGVSKIVDTYTGKLKHKTVTTMDVVWAFKI